MNLRIATETENILVHHENKLGDFFAVVFLRNHEAIHADQLAIGGADAVGNHGTDLLICPRG